MVCGEAIHEQQRVDHTGTTMTGLKLNKHGFYVPEIPLRFRTLQECQDYMAGKISFDTLPTPGTDEYDNAPFEQGYIINRHALTK